MDGVVSDGSVDEAVDWLVQEFAHGHVMCLRPAVQLAALHGELAREATTSLAQRTCAEMPKRDGEDFYRLELYMANDGTAVDVATLPPDMLCVLQIGTAVMNGEGDSAVALWNGFTGHNPQMRARLLARAIQLHGTRRVERNPEAGPAPEEGPQ